MCASRSLRCVARFSGPFVLAAGLLGCESGIEKDCSPGVKAANNVAVYKKPFQPSTVLRTQPKFDPDHPLMLADGECVYLGKEYCGKSPQGELRIADGCLIRKNVAGPK